MSGEEGRKVRSDKKWCVQPTVNKGLKECIYRLSYLTGQHVKDVIVELLYHGLGERRVVESLSKNFIRTARIDKVLYMGDNRRSPISKRSQRGSTNRITTRVDAQMHENLKTLAYAMDCSTSRACELLLTATINDLDFMDSFVWVYLRKHVTEGRMKELKKVLKHLNSKSSTDEELSWGDFLSHLIEEIREVAGGVNDKVVDFVVHNWRK